MEANAIFNDARWEWYQSPERLKENIVELTGRLIALEAELREQAPEKFVREMFPELRTINADSSSDTAMNSEEMSKALHFLVQIIQLMEDAWLSCYLDTHWNHPNNLGWMNTFQRWAYTPSFRLWWPILKPIYGSKFRRFMEEHLDLAEDDYPTTTGKVSDRGHNVPDGVAQIYWNRMNAGNPLRGTDKTVYSYDLRLRLQSQEGEGHRYDVQAGLAFVDLRDPKIARWSAKDFFVPPGLWGSGIGEKFLEKLLKDLPAPSCEVTVEKQTRIDLASLQERNDLIAFYKRAGFQLENGQLVWTQRQAVP